MLPHHAQIGDTDHARLPAQPPVQAVHEGRIVRSRARVARNDEQLHACRACSAVCAHNNDLQWCFGQVAQASGRTVNPLAAACACPPAAGSSSTSVGRPPTSHTVLLI